MARFSGADLERNMKGDTKALNITLQNLTNWRRTGSLAGYGTETDRGRLTFGARDIAALYLADVIRDLGEPVQIALMKGHTYAPYLIAHIRGLGPQLEFRWLMLTSSGAWGETSPLKSLSELDAKTFTVCKLIDFSALAGVAPAFLRGALEMENEQVSEVACAISPSTDRAVSELPLMGAVATLTTNAWVRSFALSILRSASDPDWKPTEAQAALMHRLAAELLRQEDGGALHQIEDA